MLDDRIDNELTEKIIQCFYAVYNELGFGFLEKVYENALKQEIQDRNMRVDSQKQIKVFYHGIIVGDYYADLIVEDSVIIEIKAARSICPDHEAQIYNYLRATGIKVGLILNFGPKPSISRKIYTKQQNNKSVLSV